MGVRQDLDELDDLERMQKVMISHKRQQALRAMLERLADKEMAYGRGEIGQDIREFLAHNNEIDPEIAADFISGLFAQWVTNHR